MKITYSIKINLIPLICLSALISCSSERNQTKTTSASTCTVNTSSNTELSANSLLVEVNTVNNQLLPGATVQLDHDGPCQISDENGFIRFDGLSPGNHDVHFFAKPGYQWDSEYQIDTTQGNWIAFYSNKIIVPSEPQKIEASYIKINGTIIKSDSNKSVYISQASNINKSNTIIQRGTISNTVSDFTLSYGYNEPEMTSVNTELWFFESNLNSFDQLVLIDATQVPVFISLTGPLAATGITKNIEFRSLQMKIPATQLLSFASVAYPVGFTFASMEIRGTFQSSDIPNKNHSPTLFSTDSNSNIPKSFPPNSQIEAYTTPFNFKGLTLNILTTVQNTEATSESSTWYYSSNKYQLGASNITIDPKMVNVPSLTSNQQGDTISWSASSVPLRASFITIQSQSNNSETHWRIQTNGTISEITLPVVPKDIKPILVSGIKYSVRLFGRYLTRNRTLDQFESESFSSNTIWTR